MVRRIMLVTGHTNQFESEAERKCAGSFRAWLAEMRKGQWASWTELLRFYPRARRIDENEAHFPLVADGTGIRASVIFKPGVLRLLLVAPSPAVPRQLSQSHPYSQPQPHESENTL